MCWVVAGLCCADENDFIVDDEGRPISQGKKKRHIIHDDASVPLLLFTSLSLNFKMWWFVHNAVKVNNNDKFSLIIMRMQTSEAIKRMLQQACGAAKWYMATAGLIMVHSECNASPPTVNIHITLSWLRTVVPSNAHLLDLRNCSNADDYDAFAGVRMYVSSWPIVVSGPGRVLVIEIDSVSYQVSMLASVQQWQHHTVVSLQWRGKKMGKLMVNRAAVIVTCTRFGTS